MEKYYQNTLKTIEKALCSMDIHCYKKLINSCLNTIKRKGKIIVSGLGKNTPICEKFVGTMVSLGLSSYFINSNSAMHGDLGVIQNTDLIIILTKSGNTDESVALASYLKNNFKNETWLITFSSHSKTEKYVKNTLFLFLENEGDPWNIMPINSTSIYLILLQGLAIKLAKQLKIKKETFKINHPGGSIGRLLNNEK